MADSDEEEMRAMRSSMRYTGARRAPGPEPPPGKTRAENSVRGPEVDSDDEDASAIARRLAARQASRNLPAPAARPPQPVSGKQSHEGAASSDDDQEMSADADTPMDGMRGFLPISFGKQPKKKQSVGVEVHNSNRRKDGSRPKTGVQFGRVMEPAAATGANVRAARAEAERLIKVRESGASQPNGDAVGSLITEAPAEEHADEEPDELPLPGKEKEVIPVTHEVSIPAHEKAITALALDPKAARMATGGVDGIVKFFDFNGMSEAKSCFREMEPVESHMVQATSFTCSGGLVLIVSSDSHARLYDRDGSAAPVQTTVKGDMYVRHCEHTQGHTQMLTDGMCHPFQPEHWVTSSLDGTLRIWDLNAQPVGMDQQLPSVHVLKCVDKRNVCVGGGAGRGGGLHPCCAAYSPTDAKKIVAGCSDGSVQVFFEKARYMKPDRILRTAHSSPVTAVSFVCEGSASDIMVTRSLDSTMKIWDCRMLSDAKGPLKSFEFLPAEHEKTGVCCSPDGKYIVTGTSFRKAAGEKAVVKVYDSKTFAQVKSLDFGAKSVVRMAWPREINQLVVGTSTGEVVMLYSPFSSEKGALYFVGKKAKTRSALDIPGTNDMSAPIFNMTDPQDIQKFYTTGHGNMARIRKHEARMSQKTMTPARPSKIVTEDHSGNFAAAVLKSGAKRLNLEQDSQKALLAYADKVDKGGKDSLIDRAYKHSGEKILDYTVEESEGDKRMREMMKGDFCRKCGQKVCRCVDYSTWAQTGRNARNPAHDPPPSSSDAKKPRTS